MRNGSTPTLLRIKPKYLIAALVLLVATVCIIWPLIAKAQTIDTPQYMAPSPAAVLDAKALDWSQIEAQPKTVEQMVRSEFPDAPIMLDIARAESQFNPKAKNPNSTATGVFQILIGTWNAYHCTGERTNALDNIKCARKLYDDSGTTPWNSSKSNW